MPEAILLKDVETRDHSERMLRGFGAELSALVQERCFYQLEAPISRARAR